MNVVFAFRNVFLATIVFGSAQCGPAKNVVMSKIDHQDITVLDGDTLIFEGSHVRLSGIDAPELGPWAKCWSEAALAGHAKNYVETTLYENPEAGKWKLADVSNNKSGTIKTARLIRGDGEDLTDNMVVYGYAAKTFGRWDWCGENANLHSVEEGEPQPYGPNLWWPTGIMFDKRAVD